MLCVLVVDSTGSQDSLDSGIGVLSELRVMPAPTHVDIALTGRSNLARKYCFCADEVVARGDLPAER